MKAKTLITVLLNLILFTAFSQIVSSYTGINRANEDAKSLVLTYDGGYAVCGRSDSAFKKRTLLYKYDGNGVQRRNAV